MKFAFLDVENLTDGEITLELMGAYPADIARRFVPYYAFAIVRDDTGERVGNISLRIGDDETLYLAGHIGYIVHARHRGNRYAAKACNILFSLAKRHGMHALLITCDPDNGPSRRTCEIVGGKLLEIADVPEGSPLYLEGSRQKCVFQVSLV